VRRPLVWVSGAFVGGAAFSSIFNPPSQYFFVALLFAWLLSVLLIIVKQRALAAALVVIASFLLGVCMYALDAYASEIPDQFAQNYASDVSLRVKLHGTVSHSPPSIDEGRRTFLLDVERIETGGVMTPVSGRTQVNWYAPGEGVVSGDMVEVSGKLKRLKGFKNPQIFDYERYMYRKGIFSRVYAQGPDSVAIQGTKVLGLPDRLRRYFHQEGLRVIASSIRTEETRAFLSAILLGERSLLTDEMETWFKQTGTFHVLAISGLHVGLVYLIVSLALTPVPFGPRMRVAVSIIVVWLYAFVTGGSISVTRASIMLTLVLAGYYLGREGDFLTSVAAAALFIVGLRPVVIDEAGFQLSFAAVILLCTFEPMFSDKVYPAIQAKLQRIPAPILHRLAISVFASLVIGIGMLPLIAYHFNLVSLVFPIANLVVIPLLSLVLASGFACLLTGFVWLKAASVFGLATEVFAWPIFATVKLCSMAPLSSARVVSPPFWMLALEALAIALVWWRIRLTRKIMLFAAACLLAVLISSASNHSSRKHLRATYLDVGNADACFVAFPGGETMLIDTGFVTPNLDCGERLIAPFLWKKRIRRIGTLVLTHSDNDHTGGALFLLENFRIGRLLIPDLPEASPGFKRILDAAHYKGCPVQRVSAGDILSGTGEVKAEVFNPPSGLSRTRLSDNDSSVVLRITYKDMSFFFGGDIEKKSRRLVSAFGERVRSQVMKAPHHGQASGFGKEFVELVRPNLVVISGRTFQMNERVEKRTLRYALLCDAVMATSDCGAIVVETDGHRLRIDTTRKSILMP